MTTEDKDLLLKYLCMALPYGVKVYCGEDMAMTLRQIDYNCFCECWENEDIKSHSRWKLPYLRPMSSMTDEELVEFFEIKGMNINHEELTTFRTGEIAIVSTLPSYSRHIDWLLEHHFDFMGLIPKDLAIEVTQSNNPYKE